MLLLSFANPLFANLSHVRARLHSHVADIVSLHIVDRTLFRIAVVLSEKTVEIDKRLPYLDQSLKSQEIHFIPNVTIFIDSRVAGLTTVMNQIETEVRAAGIIPASGTLTLRKRLFIGPVDPPTQRETTPRQPVQVTLATDPVFKLDATLKSPPLPPWLESHQVKNIAVVLAALFLLSVVVLVVSRRGLGAVAAAIKQAANQFANNASTSSPSPRSNVDVSLQKKNDSAGQAQLPFILTDHLDIDIQALRDCVDRNSEAFTALMEGWLAEDDGRVRIKALCTMLGSKTLIALQERLPRVLSKIVEETLSDDRIRVDHDSFARAVGEVYQRMLFIETFQDSQTATTFTFVNTWSSIKVRDVYRQLDDGDNIIFLYQLSPELFTQVMELLKTEEQEYALLQGDSSALNNLDRVAKVAAKAAKIGETIIEGDDREEAVEVIRITDRFISFVRSADAKHEDKIVTQFMQTRPQPYLRRFLHQYPSIALFDRANPDAVRTIATEVSVRTLAICVVLKKQDLLVDAMPNSRVPMLSFEVERLKGQQVAGREILIDDALTDIKNVILGRYADNVAAYYGDDAGAARDAGKGTDVSPPVPDFDDPVDFSMAN